ncbi:hypothetical protein GGX14DRAFT_581001 [Mycena pura]|uniref:DUF6987 domain-containing protein n=1 Tax=Mycena pura TaxID=153505 RepID=A0AAD6UP00_9AGAR|nr:hypothetical protein GGX14DRAFT_581001 [Mycena pura]
MALTRACELLSSIVEDANNKTTSLCKMIRKRCQYIENMENVKPLLEQAEKILNETNGVIRRADPNNRLLLGILYTLGVPSA